ncbi:MAG: Mov34/MPN/PAD-1 family protein [Methanobrevibacter sp.]|uniref:Mov34/MPN/PAD-1 family protein n=1 Tax=Methanobrevibacter sp. TaxID=66852 RepID=UPI002E78C438|nr:Mov34/MPN/PAD-1 family protein [Methanobrevibacter sp.]MEE0902708.1 Mov34/MPN/PAD-1 family protein [Methanobrevibacter sp.]MEE0935898.1 Mov34/MPN/PAD-1 family protein [Methanobrevibacter sp.]
MSFISKLFKNDDEEFNEVRVDREVLESVIYYSKQAYPNEFLAFFDGKIIDKILYITSLIFVPGETCETGAVVHTEMIPMNTKYWGSVHSHPGPSAMPSGADLKTFSKNGYFHMIVCLPYSLETFKSYDRYGEHMDYTIGDYSYLVDDNPDEFFDESDVLTENDEFKPGFFDEDDDEFFQSLDEERKDHYAEYEKQNQMEIMSNTRLPNQVIKIELNADGSVKKISKEFKD